MQVKMDAAEPARDELRAALTRLWDAGMALVDARSTVDSLIASVGDAIVNVNNALDRMEAPEPCQHRKGLMEVGLTDECVYGCKVMQCPDCKHQEVSHRSIYGCPVGAAKLELEVAKAKAKAAVPPVVQHYDCPGFSPQEFYWHCHTHGLFYQDA